MRFKTKEAKQQFIKTAMNEGLEKARQQYATSQINMVVTTRSNPNAEILGERLSDEAIKQKYPGILVVKTRNNHIKSKINAI